MLPRIMRMAMSGRSARICDCRRRAEVPMEQPGGRSARLRGLPALEHAAQREARRQHAGKVLGGMHRDVDPTLRQRLLELLREQALAADRGERAVLDPVARGPDDHGLDGAGRREPGPRAGQRLGHEPGLCERQLRAAGTEAKHGKCHGGPL
jgi:hypothetical protein